MAPRTILLKLSGEALIGEKNFGIDTDVLEYLSKEISDVKDKFLLPINSLDSISSVLSIPS